VEKEEKKDEEVIEINFKKVKEFFRRKKRENKERRKKDNEEKIEIDIRKGLEGFGSFIKKYYIVFLILIPMFFSVFFRSYPIYLPITNEWAKDSVYKSIKSEIKAQIDQQYPNLPDVNKKQLVEEQFREVLRNNEKEIKRNIIATSKYFKSRMKDKKGQTYLLAIDPYFWYYQARNKIRYGTLGDKVINGTEYLSLRNGRFGKKVGSIPFNPLFEAYLYKFLRIFDKDVELVFAAFITPIIFITLSIIPAFFIARKLGGNVAGFFSAMIIAINSALLSRTPGGFADTDCYNIFFPLMISWMFIEALEAKEMRKVVLFSSLTGFFISLYSKAWLGWSFIFDFIIATLFISFVYYLILHIKERKGSLKSIFKDKEIKNILVIFVLVVFISVALVSLLRGDLGDFTKGVKGALRFSKIKEVAVRTLWPNVYTTVAEFNKVPLNNIIAQMGGKVLFLISVIGIVLTIFVKKKGKRDIKYATFLTIWFLGTLYAFTKGTRFALLMVPAFAIAFGLGLGIGERFISKWLNKEMHLRKSFARVIVISIFLVLLIGPIKVAHVTALHETPSMTDAWYESLEGIKNNETNAIITSWWDFGHWFVAIAERHVTFDGAGQGRLIYWVGRSLFTSNETHAIGLLRMLNCGQDYAFDKLDSYVNDTVKSIDILNEIVMLNREEAKERLLKYNLTDEEAEEVLKLTHCEDIIPQFYITSDDMIGKAGVWSHFGSWNFRRAKMWNLVRKKSYDEGIKILKEEFNLSENEADRIYYEIKSIEADKWITGWYGYRSGLSSCSVIDDMVKCGNGLNVNLTTMDAWFVTEKGKVRPYSLVYVLGEDVVEKKFNENTIPYSVALIPKGNSSYESILMDKELAMSMFTRLYFFKGVGLKHFKLFSDKTSFIGQRIIIWKVDFD